MDHQLAGMQRPTLRAAGMQRFTTSQWLGRVGCYWVLGLLLIVGSPERVRAQQGPGAFVRRVVDQFLHDTLPTAQPRFLVYPALAYAPETSLEIGLSGLLLFHARNNIERSRLSEIQAFGFGTLRGQYGVIVDNFVYGFDDRWILLGRSRFQYFPLLYYGIGPTRNANEPARIDGTYLQIRQRALKKIAPNLFAGAEIDLQSLSGTQFSQPESYRYERPRGVEGTTNLNTGGVWCTTVAGTR